MSLRPATFQLHLAYMALVVFSLAQCASILRDSHLGDTFGGQENTISDVINDLKEDPRFEAPAALNDLSLLGDQEEKRAFNPWGGKRSFNPWGGKRSDEMEPVRRGFQPWGGKRSSPWGRQRSNAFGLIGTKRVFQPWGGKRTTLDSLPDRMNEVLKRRFNAWGGKRAKLNRWDEQRAFGSQVSEVK